MSAEIIMFVPKPNPNRDLKHLEQQALEIMNIALMGSDDLIFESSLGFVGPGDKEPA